MNCPLCKAENSVMVVASHIGDNDGQIKCVKCHELFFEATLYKPTTKGTVLVTPPKYQPSFPGVFPMMSSSTLFRP